MASAGGTEHQHVVLVVEDSDVTRESLGLLFHMEGYRVATAPTGRVALQLMVTMRFRPCVVVADLKMPEMDGFTFRREQLKHSEVASIPVIAVTGHEELRRRALTAGFAAALAKPSGVPELAGVIERHCRQKRALQHPRLT